MNGNDGSLQRECPFFSCFMMKRTLLDDGEVMNTRIKCQTASKNNPPVANEPSGDYSTDCRRAFDAAVKNNSSPDCLDAPNGTMAARVYTAIRYPRFKMMQREK